MMIFSKNKIAILIIGGLVLTLASCMKTLTLQNGVTRIPADSSVYVNKIKFTKELLKVVDTNVVYESYNMRYQELDRLDTHREITHYYVYRFYPNGCFNCFVINKKKELDTVEFNPDYNGLRGVYYSETNKIRYDFFASINDHLDMGRITGEFIFSGDTLFVTRDDLPGNNRIYIKRRLPAEYFQYKATW